ncbi:MAG TPA: hypothetical protein VMT46_03770 [Anaerolineaceae bacterium]|nr:hypothetical protein [Anaerolineaceae bacterium]
MLSILAVVLLGITSLFLLVSRDWRWTIVALVLQYTGVTILVANHWPMGMALVKLVVGWMASVALGLTQSGQKQDLAEERSWPSSRLFRLLAGGLMMLIISTFASKGQGWLPGAASTQVWGSFILIGIGLLQLGMTAQPFRVVIGLLTVLSGFEVIYAVVESSVLVAGLLAAVNLGLALTGAYLLTSSAIEGDAS